MRCIIVEDEAPARAELKYFLEHASRIEVAAEFENALDALKYLENEFVDCIFLDINMPSLDGMGLTKILNRMTCRPEIIFVTAHKEFAIEAFEVEAFDYILKPYSKERIIKTLKKLEEQLEKQICQDKMTIWKDDKMYVVKTNEILYCKASERNTYVYTAQDTYLVTNNITDFASKLPHDSFFRSHRSYIININRVEEIIPWFNNTYVVKFKEIKEEIPVSRNNIKEFRQIMKI